MRDILYTLANGIASGLVLAPLACAFAMVHSHARVFHFALAGIYTAAPYVAWAALEKGLPAGVAYSLAVVVGVLLSWACEQLNHRRLRRLDAGADAHLVASLGISIVLVEAIVLIFGTEVRVLRTDVAQPVAWTANLLNRSQVATAVGAVITLAIYLGWLRASRMGLALRALADNPSELSLRGRRVDRLYALAFALSGGLGAIAAILSAYDLRIEPQSGLPSLLLAVSAMILGRRHSLGGPIVGAVGLGMIVSLVERYSPGEWGDAAAYIVLAIVLVFFPEGLGGRKGRLETTPA